MPGLMRWWLNWKWASQVHADVLDRVTVSFVVSGALIAALLF